MQFTYSALAIVALSGFAAAQIPPCATSCLASAAAKAAPTCSVGDTACQCEASNKAAIQAVAEPCVLGACPSSELEAVLSGAAALCAAGPSSSPPASTTPASVAPSTSAPATSTSASASIASSTSASATTTATTSSTKATTSSTAAASYGNATTSPVPYTGSAAQIVAGVGSVLAIGIAVIAAL